VVWNQQRTGFGDAAGRSAAYALGDLRRDPTTNAVIAKLSWRLGT